MNVEDNSVSNFPIFIPITGRTRASEPTDPTAVHHPTVAPLNNITSQSTAVAPHRSLGPPGEVNKVSHPDLQEHSASWVGDVKTKRLQLTIGGAVSK